MKKTLHRSLNKYEGSKTICPANGTTLSHSLPAGVLFFTTPAVMTAHYDIAERPPGERGSMRSGPPSAAGS